MSQKQSDTEASLRVGRAIDEFRRQSGIVLEVGGKSAGFIAVESLDEAAWAHVRPLKLIITGARAKSLQLAQNSTNAFQLDASALNPAQMRFLSDPLAEKMALPPLKLTPADRTQTLALALAKYASLLPALLEVEPQRNWPRVGAEDTETYRRTPPHIIAGASAHLPLAGAENATITSFRTQHGTAEHLALAIGDVALVDTPLVRVHSSCVTGDILGSLRCDCGDQLQMALAAITQAGSGLLIYLHQEGRGIGITNKLRAYALQELGVDTYDANLMLGFEEDERDFALAAAILKHFNLKRIRLLTNNPHKIDALTQHGIAITERVPLAAKSSVHNHAYLDAKIKKSGHLF